MQVKWGLSLHQTPPKSNSKAQSTPYCFKLESQLSNLPFEDSNLQCGIQSTHLSSQHQHALTLASHLCVSTCKSKCWGEKLRVDQTDLVYLLNGIMEWNWCKEMNESEMKWRCSVGIHGEWEFEVELSFFLFSSLRTLSPFSPFSKCFKNWKCGVCVCVFLCWSEGVFFGFSWFSGCECMFGEQISCYTLALISIFLKPPNSTK